MKRGVCCLWGRDLGFLALSMETKGAGVGTVALRSENYVLALAGTSRYQEAFRKSSRFHDSCDPAHPA